MSGRRKESLPPEPGDRHVDGTQTRAEAVATNGAPPTYESLRPEVSRLLNRFLRELHTTSDRLARELNLERGIGRALEELKNAKSEGKEVGPERMKRVRDALADYVAPPSAEPTRRALLAAAGKALAAATVTLTGMPPESPRPQTRSTVLNLRDQATFDDLLSTLGALPPSQSVQLLAPLERVIAPINPTWAATAADLRAFQLKTWGRYQEMYDVAEGAITQYGARADPGIIWDPRRLHRERGCRAGVRDRRRPPAAYRGRMPALAHRPKVSTIRFDARLCMVGKRTILSTRGNQKTAVQIDGKDLYLGLNAYVYAEPKGA